MQNEILYKSDYKDPIPWQRPFPVLYIFMAAFKSMLCKMETDQMLSKRP